MKKFWILIATMLMLVVLTVAITAAEHDDPIEPAALTGTCPENEHVFETFGGYHAGNNQHTYYCSNEGCESYRVDKCYYNSSCVFVDAETLPCEKCGIGYGTVHDYSYAHDTSTWKEDAQHILTCSGFDEMYMCGRTSGTSSPCNFYQEVTSNFIVDRGHPVLEICSVCNYSYRLGFFYPEGHPVGCEYCP